VGVWCTLEFCQQWPKYAEKEGSSGQLFSVCCRDLGLGSAFIKNALLPTSFSEF
jgi:hypothetical protein